MPIYVYEQNKTRIDVYETLCPQQMLVHKGGKIKNWGGECRDVTPTKSLSQNIRVIIIIIIIMTLFKEEAQLDKSNLP